MKTTVSKEEFCKNDVEGAAVEDGTGTVSVTYTTLLPDVVKCTDWEDVGVGDGEGVGVGVLE